MSALALQPMRRALIAVAVLSVLWGYNWVVMKRAMEHTGPFYFSALRFGVATVSLFAALLVTRQTLRLPRQEWIPLAWLGFLLTVNFGCVTTALVVGSAGKIAVLVYGMPFWALLLARFWLHERLQRWQWLTVILAFLGLLILIDPLHQLSGVTSSALAIFAGFLWAISVLLVKQMQNRDGVPMITLTFWQGVLGCAGFLIASAVIPQKPIEWSWLFAWYLFFSGVLSTAFSWLLFYYALRRMPVGLISLSTLVTPVIGVLAAWVELGERPNPAEATGMLLIGAALALLIIVPFFWGKLVKRASLSASDSR